MWSLLELTFPGKREREKHIRKVAKERLVAAYLLSSTGVAGGSAQLHREPIECSINSIGF